MKLVAKVLVFPFVLIFYIAVSLPVLIKLLRLEDAIIECINPLMKWLNHHD